MDVAEPDAAALDLADLKGLVERTDTVYRLIGGVMGDLLEWSRRRHKPAAFRRDLRRLGITGEAYPEQWLSAVEEQVQAAAVMRRPDQIRKFRARMDDLLDDDERRLLRDFGRQRWFWSAFSVLEQRGDVHRVMDHLSGRELLLCSDWVTSAYREGFRLFFTLLLFNGSCHQTFGPLHHYRGFEPFDFNYLAKALLPAVLKTRGAEAVVAAKPAPFIALTRYTLNRAVVHEGIRLLTCAHDVKVESFTVDDYPGDFDTPEVCAPEGLLKARLKHGAEPECADLYYDRRAGRLTVVATTLHDYQEIAQLLRGRVPLPDQPDWYASVNMAAAASGLGVKEHPAMPYERRLDACRGRSREADAEQLIKLKEEMLRLHEADEPYSLEGLAARFEVPEDMVQMVEDSVLADDETLPGLPGGIPGCEPLPADLEPGMDMLPSNSAVLLLNHGPEAQRAYAERRDRVLSLIAQQRAAGADVSARPDDDGELPLKGLPRLLEDLFYASWNAPSPVVLTYTLYLLCREGHTPHDARSYGVEVLRVFWKEVLPRGARAYVDVFLNQYREFCRTVLEPLGLIEIEVDAEAGLGLARAAGFRLRGGPVLNAFIRLNPEFSPS